MSEKSKLYAVAWRKGHPYVVSTDATRHDGTWSLEPLVDGTWDEQLAFSHRFYGNGRIDEYERKRLRIGKDSQEALRLAMEYRATQEEELEESLSNVRSELTELAELLIVAGGKNDR
jgi:hypothetical protein